MSDFSIISLGCPKNTVDSEKLAEQMCRNGFKIAPSEEDAAIIIVNTCAFIHEAERESIDTIIDILPSKKKNCKILAVAGCLPERYKQELVRALPDVDIFIGPNRLHELPGILKNGVREKQHCLFGIDPEANINFSQSRVLPEGTNYAYLKIADGCDHSCSFCIIPKIKGPYRSRPLKEIKREAEELVSSGIKELILIAQDTTGYGMDTEGKKMLPDLLRKISKIKGLRRLRLMYTYPGEIDDELLYVMAGSDVICKYIDMPLQHVSKNVLKMMKRGGSKAQFTKLIRKIRKVLPGCAIRSTFIVGHPGETEEDFQELMDFLTEMKLEKVGIFPYSPEEGTESVEVRPRVRKNTMMRRYRKAMLLQQEISRENNRKFQGRVLPVMVDAVFKAGSLLGVIDDPEVRKWLPEVVGTGRTNMDAPEIDGQVYITGQVPSKGDIMEAEIIDSSAYDLLAKIRECNN